MVFFYCGCCCRVDGQRRPDSILAEIKAEIKKRGKYETVTNCHGLKMTASVVMDVLVRIRMAFGCGMDDVVEIER